MDIGGHDLVYSIPLKPAEIIEDLTKISLSIWPEQIIEDESRDKYERFIYKNKDWHNSWGKDGYTEQNANTMIHILASEGKTEGQATIVCDDPNSPEMAQYILEVESFISKLNIDDESKVQEDRRKRVKDVIDHVLESRKGLFEKLAQYDIGIPPPNSPFNTYEYCYENVYGDGI